MWYEKNITSHKLYSQLSQKVKPMKKQLVTIIIGSVSRWRKKGTEKVSRRARKERHETKLEERKDREEIQRELRKNREEAQREKEKNS